MASLALCNFDRHPSRTTRGATNVFRRSVDTLASLLRSARLIKIVEAFYYLHTEDSSCWTHELPLMPFSTGPGC